MQLFTLVSPSILSSSRITPATMSDSDAQDGSTLGKRGRNETQDDETIPDASTGKQPKTEEDDSEDDVGPMPLPAGEAEGGTKKKKRKGMLLFILGAVWPQRVYNERTHMRFRFWCFLVLPHERLYLEHLPNTEQYYKSFMHRDVINYSVMTKWVAQALRYRAKLTFGSKSRTDFLITTSVDGHLKLWKKQETGIEFVKHYRAHLTPITGVSASADGQLFATISEDQTAKVFDVVNFGMHIPPFVEFLMLTM